MVKLPVNLMDATISMIHDVDDWVINENCISQHGDLILQMKHRFWGGGGIKPERYVYRNLR